MIRFRRICPACRRRSTPLSFGGPRRIRSSGSSTWLDSQSRGRSETWSVTWDFSSKIFPVAKGWDSVATTGTFAYHVVLAGKEDPQPVSLIAAWIETGKPLQAVLWNLSDQAWIYAPAVAAQRLYDDQYQDTVRPVDRMTAEQIARTALGTHLPDPQVLLQMCQDGRATGLIWGPRRS